MFATGYLRKRAALSSGMRWTEIGRTASSVDDSIDDSVMRPSHEDVDILDVVASRDLDDFSKLRA